MKQSLLNRTTLSPSLSHWLAHYRSSDLFACFSKPALCTPFHVLAPILHSIGAFRSYSSYSSIIQQSVAFTLASQDRVKVLVSGIDSDASVASLLNAISPFREWVTITLVDICPTPLRRTMNNPHLLLHATEMIQDDIFSYLDLSEGLSFDLIMADSFLKQFDHPNRLRLLGLFSKALRNHYSLLVLREYVGRQDLLIDLLWRRFNLNSLDIELSSLSQQKRADTLKLLETLRSNLLRTGHLYCDQEELTLDLEASGFMVKNAYASKQVADIICVARRI